MGGVGSGRKPDFIKKFNNIGNYENNNPVILPDMKGVERHLKTQNVACSGDHRNENGDGWVLDVAPSSETGAAFDIGRMTGYSNNGNTAIGQVTGGLFLAPDPSNDTSQLAFIDHDGSPWFKIEGDYTNGTVTLTNQIGTLTQFNIETELDMSSNKIVNVTDPTSDQDAATKKYVDDNVNPSRTVYQFGEASLNVSAGSTGNLVVINGVAMTANQGIPVMCTTSGELDQIRINYDLNGLAGFNLKFLILVNGTTQYTSSSITTSGNNKTFNATGLGISVSAGDLIRIRADNSAGTQTLTITNLIGCYRITED